MSFLSRHFRTETPAVTDSDVICFGDTLIHDTDATSHFLLAGATGSGKTTLILRLLKDVLPTIRAGADRRMLLTNPKQDLLPLLQRIAPRAQIISLDPYDSCGYRWEACDDITDVRTAVQFLYTLFPSQKSAQPFFENATRHIGFAVIVSFLLSQLRWTLGDLLRVLRSHDYICSVLKKHSYTAPVYDQYFADPRLAQHVIASIAARLLPFEPIAASWDSASNAISLLHWSTNPIVLILPHSEISRAATDTINRCIFKRASDITLNQTESFTRKSWFVFDELSDSPRFDGLVSLLKKGRSKGACVLVAFQSVSGLRDSEKYGPEFTDEILGQIANKFIGRLECPVTAEWASRLIGDQEVEGVSRSKNYAREGTTSSETRQIQMRRAVLPSEFMMIEPCGIDTGLSGFFVLRSAGAFFTTLDPNVVFSSSAISSRTVPLDGTRPPETQFLHVWTPEEAASFGAVSQALGEASQGNDCRLDLDDIDELLK